MSIRNTESGGGSGVEGRGGEAVTQALKVVFLEWVWHEQINHE